MDYQAVMQRLTEIRDFRPADAPALAALYLESVMVLGPTRYVDRQVKAWASLAPDAAALRQRYAQSRLCLVAETPGAGPVAFGDLRDDGLIGYFYGRPGHTRSDVTSKLYEELERRARAMGLAALKVEASEMAKGFFLRRGFKLHARQDFSIGSVGIHNYAMTKFLAAPN